MQCLEYASACYLANWFDKLMDVYDCGRILMIKLEPKI